MPKLIIKFPQIIFEEKEIEVTQEKYMSLIEDRKDVSKFIWDNLSEQEKSCSSAYKELDSFIDCGACGVYESKKT